MFSKEQVIEKVRKLIALGENAGATEAERERAMSQAHKFLAKYNLDLTAIGSGDESDRTNEITEFVNTPASRRIAAAIAELYFCKYLFYKGSNRHVFIGSTVNVTAAIEITKWLVAKAGKQARWEANHANPTGIPNSKYFTGFMHGASDTIAARAYDIIEATKAQQSDAVPGTSLVLADVYDTEREANEKYAIDTFGKGKSTKRRARKNIDRTSYYSGVEHGKSVNLQKQVN